MISEADKPRGLFSTWKLAVREFRQIFKNGGFKAVARRYGWKLFAAFIVYYMIRDFLIYIAIPYLIAKHFLN